jgi:hypothetical protein
VQGSVPITWRTNLRGNLDLWPDVSPNIEAVCKFDSKPYNEEQILQTIPSEGARAPTDGRTVRNTVEILALSGLGYKDDSSDPIFRLTNLGRCVFSFLGVMGPVRFANEHNRHLLADAMIRALGTVIEYRAIWALMLGAGNLLTNEELNRGMGRTRFISDIPAVAEDILAARKSKNPADIGPRIYEDEKFGSPAEADQRKAMNPLFLLAGGGRIFLQLDQTSEFRRLEDWAIPLIERQLSEPSPFLHASTQKTPVELMSRQAALSDYWSG